MVEKEETASEHEMESPQVTADSPGTSNSLRARLQRPLLIFAVIGIVCSVVAIWLKPEWLYPPDESSRRFVSPFEAFDLTNASIPRNEILPGGPGKDGIPALNDPKFVDADAAEFLNPEDRVVGIVIQDRARAYPLKILDYHEAVNDRIADVPFAVTYCPLCDSATVFDRKVAGGGEFKLGISGLLYNSNVLLFNRKKDGGESLWSQMKLESVSGPQVGSRLQTLPLEVTTWSEWSDRHPQTQVLSTQTGHARNYMTSPYSGYPTSERLMFPVRPTDDRLPNKTRVLGVWTKTSAMAFPISAFESEKKRTEFKQQIDGLSLTVAYHPQAKSLRVVRADDGIEWMYSYWFAWFAFHPTTELYQPSGP